MWNRRKFLKSSLIGTAGLLATPVFASQYFSKKEVVKITLLHTNDMHSHIEPFPINDPKYPGLGGMVRRAALIQDIRKQEKNVLLLDAGDVFQGTPYFNFFGGELEFKLMSKMGYDACAIGNHDFDNGMEGLKKMMPFAAFPFLCANYDFKDTLLKGSTIPNKIFEKAGLKIGVFGLGVELKGLVSDKNYGDTQYLDPIKISNKQASYLKNEMHCDLVICLSHLGYDDHKNPGVICDKVLAKETSNINVIIGGHTHTFLDKPVPYKNKIGKQVLVNQVGWAGVRLGRIDVYFSPEKEKISEASLVYGI